ECVPGCFTGKARLGSGRMGNGASASLSLRKAFVSSESAAACGKKRESRDAQNCGTHPNMKKLSHFGKGADVTMVDVTAKEVTHRTAVAHGFVHIGQAALQQVRRRKTPKGDPLEIARIAGIA